MAQGDALVEAPVGNPTALTNHGPRQYVESKYGVRLFLQNCVSTVNLDFHPDLAHIATHARNAEYNPKRFSAAVIRLRDPKATALLFQSGKMVTTGARNEDDSRLAARKVAKIVKKLGGNASFKDFRIQNIVGTGGVSFPIRLEGLADEHGRMSSYEPELFPGLVYRMERPKVVVLIFVSGKIVITGAKTRETMVEAFDKIYPVLCKYKKRTPNTVTV